MDKGNLKKENVSDEQMKIEEISFEDIIKADDEDDKDNDNHSFKEEDYEIDEGPDDGEEIELRIEEDIEDEDEEEEEEEEEKEKTETTYHKEIIVNSKNQGQKNIIPISSRTFVRTSTPSNSLMIQKVISTTSSSNFMKISPRTITTTTSPSTSSTVQNTTAVKTPNGKIIYLQRAGGSSVPVRVPSSISSNSTSNNSSKSSVAITVIRTPDGNLVPFKGNRNINIPNSQLSGKKIIQTSSAGTTQQMFKKVPTSSAGGTKAIGSTIITSIDGERSKVRQIVAPKSLLNNVTNGSATTSQKVVMQSPSTMSRQVMVSGNMIKLSPNSSGGQLKAIQIPGKPGIQYVRVLQDTSGIKHKIAIPEPKHKYTVLRQSKPTIMVKSPIYQEKDRKMLSAVQTFRKVNGGEVLVRTSETGEKAFVRTQKISQINSQIGRICHSNDNKSDASASKYVVVPSTLIRSTVNNPGQKYVQQKSLLNTRQVESAAAPGTSSNVSSTAQVKKLYTVLRPTNEPVFENKIKTKTENLKAPSNAVTDKHSSRSSPQPSDDSSNAIRRKHCNCTKSQCLKLYCDCFANGEFCQDCNCKDCLNNLDNEDERQKAIRVCLERNPNSFKPKITAADESDQRLHNKGCNCKRSGCLKNYCECYEAKIPCSSNCKCVGCRNIDDHPDLDMDAKKIPVPTSQTYNRAKRSYEDISKPRASNQHTLSAPQSVATVSACGPPSEKQPCNFITQDVVDATIQCLIAQADECEKGELSPYQTEKMVMEELGRCLVEIIDFSIRNTD